MTDKQTDDNENIDDVDAPSETEETRNLSLEDAADALDHDALAKLAEESVSGADPDDMDEGDVEARDEGVVPEATKGDDTKQETENKDTAAAADATADKGEQPAGDTKDDKQDTKIGDVLTKDGKHTIPYSVLEDTRKRLQAEEARRQELESELEKAKAGDTGDKGADSGEVKLTEEEQAHVDRLREEYGDELAAPVEAAYLRSARLEQRIEGIQQAAPSDNKDTEAQEIQAAIDASPVMATWQARGDDWYQRSVEVYNTAMANDPDFAAMSREQQFQELPNRVQALYGKDKSLVTDTKPADTKPEDTKPADTKPADTKPADTTTEGFKGTSSDIPGGAPPDSSKYGPVDGMSPQAIQAYMDEQAEKGTLEDFANAIA